MSRIKKLLRMPPGEIRGRLHQELRSRREWLAGTIRGPREMGDEAFLKTCFEGGARASGEGPWRSFRDRAPGAPFPGLGNPRETMAVLQEACPEAVEGTLRRAEGIVGGQVSFLGCTVDLPDPVDWHLEPVTGTRVPLRHWSRIDHLDPGVAGEFKVVWEVNRHQYFLSLAQAYALTGDERFADTVCRHLSSWMDENPPGWGINWNSSLELAYRVIAWIWTLHLIRDASAMGEALFVRCLKLMYLQGLHIERHLSTYFSPNTHLTGEALGLLYLGAFFPELEAASRWRRLGAGILQEQLPVQLLEDGVYFEHASAYGGYTLDIYLHTDILLEHLGTPLPPPLRARLLCALEHLRHLVRPDGMIPLWGDDDGGRLLPLTHRKGTDFTDTLCVGAHRFGRGDLMASPRATPETLLTLGPAVLDGETRRTDPETGSRSFPAGGVHVLRDGWDPEASYTMISAGPHGSIGGGHAHADALSVEVTLRGRPLVVDPGTYSYRRDREVRNQLRSAWAHSSVVVDGTPVALPADSPFVWRSSTDARVEHFCPQHDFDFFQGVVHHPGEPAVRHTRRVFFMHRGCVVVWDRLEGEGDHDVDLRFQLAPGWDVEVAQTRVDCVQQDGRRASFHCFGSPGGRWDTFETLVSSGYGEATPSTGLRWGQEARGAQHVVTVMDPHPGEGVLERTVAPDAILALSLGRPRSEDLLLLGLDGRHTVRAASGGHGAEIEGEAALVWLRASPGRAPAITAAVLARNLQVGGVALDGGAFVECARWPIP